MGEEITTAFSTALTTIKTDAMSLIATALPPALLITGVFIVVKLGVRFFQISCRLMASKFRRYGFGRIAFFSWMYLRPRSAPARSAAAAESV